VGFEGALVWAVRDGWVVRGVGKIWVHEVCESGRLALKDSVSVCSLGS
jgi:hypothetical protein